MCLSDGSVPSGPGFPGDPVSFTYGRPVSKNLCRLLDLTGILKIQTFVHAINNSLMQQA